jgi:hypothetical protein
MSKWVTRKLNYKKCKIEKNILWFNFTASGYELLDDLVYEYSNDFYFILERGYVWDGASFPKVIQFAVGKRNSEALLAASAMHDSMENLLVYDKRIDLRRYEDVSIICGANIYRRMIRQWENDDDKPNKLQRYIQLVGLIIFQPIYKKLTKRKHD